MLKGTGSDLRRFLETTHVGSDSVLNFMADSSWFGHRGFRRSRSHKAGEAPHGPQAVGYDELRFSAGV